jgi:hypothetical protein
MSQRRLEAPRAEPRQRIPPSNVEVRYSIGSGLYKIICGSLLDTGAGGLGIKTTEPLHVHSIVDIFGQQNGVLIQQQATVRWRRPTKSGGFRVGLRLIGRPNIKQTAYSTL